MTGPHNDNGPYSVLRERAQRILKEQKGGKLDTAGEEFMEILHELEVHRIELDLQNEELRRVMRDLETSRNDYADLFNSAPVGFMTLHKNGTIERVNRTALDILKAEERILLGSKFSQLIAPQGLSVYFEAMRKISTSSRQDTREICELKLDISPANTIYVRLEISASLGDQGQLVEWRFAIADITKQKEAEVALRRSHDVLEERISERTAELHKKNDELQKMNDLVQSYNNRISAEHARRIFLSKRLVEILETERRQMAMTLHDQIGQDMVTLNMDLEILQNRLSEGSKADEVLSAARKKATEIIRYMRDFSQSLRPDVLDTLGLVPGIQSLISRTKQLKSSIDIQFFTTHEHYPINLDKKTALYRICQEALTNCIKHADADTINITITKRDNSISLSIEDSGKGFDYKKISNLSNKGEGFQGISIMRERAIQLGGDFWVETEFGRGTLIMALIPMESEGEHGEKQ